MSLLTSALSVISEISSVFCFSLHPGFLAIVFIFAGVMPYLLNFPSVESYNPASCSLKAWLIQLSQQQVCVIASSRTR